MIYGFYNLTYDDVMVKQTSLAKKYGIYGFCFYYYWFSGEKILHRPLQKLLKNKNIDIHYFFMWANENWTKTWDGGNNEVIKSQGTLEEGISEKFMNDILPFFKDDRYFKIDNKPVLSIYRCNLFDLRAFKDFVLDINRIAIDNGFDGVYLISTNAMNDVTKPSVYGVSAKMEFSPFGIDIDKYLINNLLVSPVFKGYVVDGEQVVKDKLIDLGNENYDYEFYRTVFPSWDNTARKAKSGATVFNGMNPYLYKVWLKAAIRYSKNNKENIVFVNAWNEWAEGAHLEPDYKFGYGYLVKTREAIEESRSVITQNSID